MTEPEGQYEEDFFENAFKFLDPPKNEEKTGELPSGQSTERKKFKITDYSKENRPESPRVLEPEHPLLVKFQQALKDHLLRQIELVSEDVFELETETKKMQAEREKLGLETYETQQVVCKEQKIIEEYMDEIENVSMANQELENHIEALTVEYNDERQKLFEAERKELELRNELESVNLLLQKMSCWEQDVETELKTSLRISEKTKKEKIALAAEKRELDMIIYRLMTEVWRLENEIETMDMQLRVKEEDKERVAIAVALSATDIEALESENKCLIQSWTTVVNAISNRDKTFNGIQNEVRIVNENIKSTIAEIEQIRKVTKKEMVQNEALTMFKNRVLQDLKNCAHLLENEKGKQDDLEKKLVNFQNVIDATDKNIKMVHGEAARKEVEYRQLIKDFEKLAREKTVLEEKILELLQDQITNDKAGMYLKKLVRQVKEKNRDMQITLSTVENTNAKTLMDIEAQKFINEKSERLIDELKRKVDEYNADIKAIQTETEKLVFTMHKKQREFDIVTKQYDVAKSKVAVKESSSLEEKCKNLEKEITEIEQQIKNLQKYWLRDQENMVILTKARQDQIKDHNLLKKQILILEQKNLKLSDDLEALKKQDEKMNRSITNLLSRQTMLQEQFNKKKGNREDISKENTLIQSEYLCQLEEAEMQALKLQADLEELEENKTNLSKDLIDKNREALAWEKKMMLAVETKQNMIKETSSEGEVGHMKAEIHRMTVRFSQLKKAQDKLIVDLEQCVTRRDAIATVADAREKRGVYARPQKINYARNMDDMKNKIKKVQMEIEETDKDIENARKTEEELKKKIKDTELEAYSLDDEIAKTKENIEIAITDKQKLLEMLILKQRKLQMLNDIARKRPIKYLFKDESLLILEFERQKIINEKLINIATTLISDFPGISQEIIRILNTLKMATDTI